MAIHFTIEERCCLLSLWRQSTRPSYDEHCRLEEAWLKQHAAALTSAITKLNSEIALDPAIPDDLIAIVDEKEEAAREHEALLQRNRVVSLAKDKASLEAKLSGAEKRVLEQTKAADDMKSELEKLRREAKSSKKSSGD